MKGLLFPGDRQVRVESFPDPEAGPAEVVVALRAAAVCGSDLHGYRASSAARQRGGFDRIIPGHEPSGVVHLVGEGVTNVAVGDRVAVYHYRGCGACAQCRGGRLMWCPARRGYGGAVHGSDADLLVTDARNCLPLPGEASFEEGALLMCVAGTAYEAMRKLDVSGRATVAISGLGPVGLTGLLMARAMGAQVIGIDVVPARLELAARLGAAAVVDAAHEDPVIAVDRWSGGQGVSSVFETSGTTAGQATAVAVAGYGGRVAFVGLGTSEPSISPSQFIQKQLTLFGSFVFALDAYEEILRFVRRHEIPLAATVTHRAALDAAPDLLPLCDRGETGKVVFIWDGG